MQRRQEAATTSLKSLELRLVSAMMRPLPGLDAQLRMAPQPRIGWDPQNMPAGLRDGAALLLVYPALPGESNRTAPGHGGPPNRHKPEVPLARGDKLVPHILLTVRAAGLRQHTGQVSLPGGAVDPDESYETAALREASEEVGCIPAAVRVIGRLTPLHIPVSGFHLHPIVGVVDERPEFRAAEWEVARLLEVPIDLLRDPATLKRQTESRRRGGETIEVDVPYFDIDGEKVWGATAMILAEFLAVLDD